MVLRDSSESVLRQCRLRSAHRIHHCDPVCDRVARQIEPTPASVGMTPALEVHALGVLPNEQIVRPGGVADFERGPRYMGGAAE